MKKSARILCLLMLPTLLLASCSSAIPALKEPETKAIEYDLSAAPAKIKVEGGIKGYDFWLAETEKLISLDKQADIYGSKAGDSGDYAWGTSYVMASLFTAYCTTGDKKYLDTYAIICDNMYGALSDKDGDGYLGWGTAGYSQSGNKYEEFAVHTGLCIKGWADFITLVRSDTKLGGLAAPKGGTLGELADKLEKAVNEQLIPAFDKDFSNDLGIYLNRPGSGNYAGQTGTISLPHNQYLSFAIGLYAMAAVSPDYAPDYLSRADSMSVAFKSFIKAREDGSYYWNYSDKFFATDYAGSGSEDFSHGMMDYRAAVESYNNGGPFEYKDLGAFAANLVKYMFNGDYNNPSVTYNVDGGGSVDNIPYIYNIMLSRYNEMVWQICAKAYESRLTDAALILSLHPEAPAPESFALAGPAEGSNKVSPSAAVFSWTPSKYASDYCLQVATDKEFKNIVTDRPYITGITAIADKLSPGKQYFWRVTAHNQAGKTKVSETHSFKTTSAKKAEKRVLSFSVKAKKPEKSAERYTLRVYSYYRLVYEAPLYEDDKWHDVRLDLTEDLANRSFANLRFELYCNGESDDDVYAYLDDISITGSSDPVEDFEKSATEFYGVLPVNYLEYNEIGVKDGAGKKGKGLCLLVPPTSLDPYCLAYYYKGFSLK